MRKCELKYCKGPQIIWHERTNAGMKKASVALTFLLAVAFAADAVGEASLPPATIVAGNGNVAFGTGPRNQIIGLTTRLFVPLKPAPAGTLFLWPGLQPGPEG